MWNFSLERTRQIRGYQWSYRGICLQRYTLDSVYQTAPAEVEYGSTVVVVKGLPHLLWRCAQSVRAVVDTSSTAGWTTLYELRIRDF